eukprot:5151126-Pleurochrysis_carterae.AAC.1
MIAYVGDVLLDDCFNYVKLMGQYENGMLLIRKNSGSGEKVRRSSEHFKVTFSNKLVADCEAYFAKKTAREAEEDTSNAEDHGSGGGDGVEDLEEGDTAGAVNKDGESSGGDYDDEKRA